VLPQAAAPFWLAGLVWTLVFFIVFLILLYWLSGGQSVDEKYFQTLEADRATNIAFLISAGILLYPSLAIQIKRLHDLNLPGWWCLPAFAPGFILYLAALIGLGSIHSPTLLFKSLIVGTDVVSLVNIIVLGSIRGTAGPNRYGHDSLMRTAIPVVP
jgi:uncharacterized membrane protein YhaH (DUF805 family)